MMTKMDTKQILKMTGIGTITDWSWITDAKRYYIKDPYDGFTILSESTRREMYEWCEQHCENEFWIGMGFGQFKSEKDAALFLMRWSR